MSPPTIKITVEVPLDIVAAMKGGKSGTETENPTDFSRELALMRTAKLVADVVDTLPYDGTNYGKAEENENAVTKSAAWALEQAVFDDTFTVAVIRRRDATFAASIRVRGANTVAQLVEAIEDKAGVAKELQYLFFENHAFYHGSGGTYDENKTLQEVGISDDNAMVELVCLG